MRIETANNRLVAGAVRIRREQANEASACTTHCSGEPVRPSSR